MKRLEKRRREAPWRLFFSFSQYKLSLRNPIEFNKISLNFLIKEFHAFFLDNMFRHCFISLFSRSNELLLTKAVISL